MRWSPTATVIPRALARVRTTSIIWGWHSRETKKTDRSVGPRVAHATPIASAAAVASSSSEAFAIGRPGQIGHHRLKIQQRLQPPCATSA